MMTLDIVNALNEKVGAVDVRDEVFGSRVNPDLMWESVVHANAKDRQGTQMAKNRALFTWVDLETEPQVDQLLKQFGITEADTPVLACGRKFILRNPSNLELADMLGIHQPLEQAVCDLAVVGAGPAGRTSRRA